MKSPRTSARHPSRYSRIRWNRWGVSLLQLTVAQNSQSKYRLQWMCVVHLSLNLHNGGWRICGADRLFSRTSFMSRWEKPDGEKGKGVQQAALALGLWTTVRVIESACLNESVACWLSAVLKSQLTEQSYCEKRDGDPARLCSEGRPVVFLSYHVLCIHKFRQLSDTSTRFYHRLADLIWLAAAAFSFLQDTVRPGMSAVCSVSVKDMETWRPDRSCWRSLWLTVLLTTSTACWLPPVTFRVRSFSCTFTTIVNRMMMSQTSCEPI